MKKGLSQIVIIAAAALLISTSLVFAFLQKNKTSEKLTPSPSPISQYQTDETVYTDEGSANWKTYTNSNFRYSLTYPNDWYVIEPGNDGARSINIQNYLESDITEAEKKNVSIEPNKISITVGLYDENIESNQSLTDFLKATDRWVSAMNGEPTSVEDIKIAGKPALKLNYGEPFYVFSDGENVFYSYFFLGNSYFLLTFDQILSTFRFD